MRLRTKQSWPVCLARPFLRPTILSHQFPFSSSWPFSFLLDWCSPPPLILSRFLLLSLLHSGICCLISITCFQLVSRCLTALSTRTSDKNCIHPCAYVDLLVDTDLCNRKQVWLTDFTLKQYYSTVLLKIFLQIFVYTVGGIAFQLDLPVVIDYAWCKSCAKSEHRMWTEGSTMSSTRGISVTLWLMGGMLKRGDEARTCSIYQPVCWWCDSCTSIVGNRMFLFVCLLWFCLIYCKLECMK